MHLRVGGGPCWGLCSQLRPEWAGQTCSGHAPVSRGPLLPRTFLLRPLATIRKKHGFPSTLPPPHHSCLGRDTPTSQPIAATVPRQPLTTGLLSSAHKLPRPPPASPGFGYGSHPRGQGVKESCTSHCLLQRALTECLPCTWHRAGKEPTAHNPAHRAHSLMKQISTARRWAGAGTAFEPR